jgi:hypothetical protein
MKNKSNVSIRPIEPFFTVPDQSAGILNMKHAKIPQNIAKLFFVLFRVKKEIPF